jgi:3-methyladenine DNA glycosylase AlkD
MAAYMRHVAPFLGVKTPQRRAAGRPLLQAVRRAGLGPAGVMAVVTALFAQPEREFAYLAIDLLKARIGVFENDAIVRQVFPLIDERPWWDTVDALRAALGRWAGDHLDERTDLVEQLLTGSMWRRRVAITLQIGHGDQTDRELLARAIRANSGDSEFFIRKAIGWALRDFARTDPGWVLDFVERENITGLARREATKHLGEHPGG